MTLNSIFCMLLPLVDFNSVSLKYWDIDHLQAACKNAPDSSDAERAVDLYDTAFISSGFSVSRPLLFIPFSSFLMDDTSLANPCANKTLSDFTAR